jgi:hypothetical protein
MAEVSGSWNPTIIRAGPKDDHGYELFIALSRYSLTRAKHSSSPKFTQDPTAATVLFLDLRPWVIWRSDLGRLRT